MNTKTAVRFGRGLVVLLAALLAIQLAGRLTGDVGSARSAEDSNVIFPARVIRLRDTLPNLPLMTIPAGRSAGGSATTLASILSGSPGPCVFLIVYSTTCGACRKAAAAWGKAAPHVRSVLDSAVRWVSLPDRPDRIQAFREQFGLDTPHFILPFAEAAAAIGAVGTPTVYAVDRDLRVVRMPGAAPADIIRGKGGGTWEASCRGSAI